MQPTALGIAAAGVTYRIPTDLEMQSDPPWTPGVLWLIIILRWLYFIYTSGCTENTGRHLALSTAMSIMWLTSKQRWVAMGSTWSPSCGRGMAWPLRTTQRVLLGQLGAPVGIGRATALARQSPDPCSPTAPVSLALPGRLHWYMRWCHGHCPAAMALQQASSFPLL